MPERGREMPVGTLIINEFGKDTREFRMAGGSVRIGRDPRGDIVLSDIAVSRAHARIVQHGESFLVEDLGSPNGTLLNDMRLPAGSSRPLSHGDRLQIGRSVIRFLVRFTSRLSARLKEREGISEFQRLEGKRGDSRPEGYLCLFRLEKLDPALLLSSEDKTALRHPLRSDRVRIGRDLDSDVVLADPASSERHAEIVYNREGFHLIDLDSTLGTFLDGVAVRVARLSHRSYVRFGREKALFIIREEGKDLPESSFGLRDRLAELYPDRRKAIQKVFKDCRAGGLDFAEELILRGVLDPEEWWEATKDYKDKTTSWRLSTPAGWLRRVFSRKRREERS
ncbi:MAG: FHA domain-containing protein [Planctomycetes bacterium]|nr:FHA domain-containing protein [Planctomycetota bacterium]